MPALQFSVQQIGNYSYLALENVGVPGLGAGSLPSAGAGLPPPPLNEAMLGTPPTSTQTIQAQSGAQQASLTPGRAWSGWFLGIRNQLNALAAGAGGQSPVSLLLEVPSVDETDTAWYATLSSAVGITDPLTFTPGFSVLQSLYGRTFQPGDYVLIADTDTYVDAKGVRQYRFEIALLAAISSAGIWTLERASGTPGQARFGTPLVPHTPGLSGSIRIYRLIDKFWNILLPAPGIPQLLKLPWDSMCIPVVQGTVHGAPTVSAYLVPDASKPAVPGFRTLSGAEYTLGNPAAVALGQTSILRLSVAGWHSIRNMFFELDGAAGTGAATDITLAYISPDRTKAYRLATFTLAAGSRQSYTAAQQNLRFPAGSTWPPHANLPLMTGALDANGVLQNGFTIDLTKTASIQEDGEIDYIITANATTPGVGLRGTVQT